MRNSRYFFNLGICTLLSASMSSSCKKLVEVSAPVTSSNAANVYTSDATAIAAVTGVYTTISASNFPSGELNSMSVYAALSADELTFYSGVQGINVSQTYYSNTLSSTNLGSDFWYVIYQNIYEINAAIEGLTNSSGLTAAVKQQLLGEAKFLRAFCYFYLVNLYGDVPLALSTDYTVNSVLARAPQTKVYQNIVADLQDAQSKLSSNFLDGSLLATTPERVRPTKWAATALLARTYMYEGDWKDAEAEADSVINNNAPFPLAIVNNLNSVFLKNSNEAIWQLQPVKVGQNTPDAWFFVLPVNGPSSSYPVYLSTSLLNSFEPGDQRAKLGNWIQKVVAGSVTYYYPFKYKSAMLNAQVTEYEMVLRVGEQYLIRAEARAHLGENTAINDLNVIRNRAGLANFPDTTDVTALQNAIYHERQVELFTEWGHRWLDLKRTGVVDSVMSAVTPGKGGTWNADWQWYPIQLPQLQADPFLVQNKGY